MRASSWLSISLAACGSTAAPLTNTMGTPSVPAFVAPPTLITAGGTTCKVGDAIELAQHAETSAVLGFDAASGLAVWKPDPATLALQPLVRDGTRRGQMATLPLADGNEPDDVVALGGRFVVLVRRWDWQHDDVRWWGVVVDASGYAGPLVDLGLAGLDVDSARATSASEIVLTVSAAAIAKHPETPPLRGQTLTVTGDHLASRPSKLVPSPAAAPFRYVVINAVDPPPPGPGGTIYEPLGRPVLERTNAGARVGQLTALEFHGNPIAFSMNIDPYIAWSGTHFLYPFREGALRLLPIDCR